MQFLVPPEVVPKEVMEGQRGGQQEEQKLLADEGPEEVHEYLAPELREEPRKGENQADGQDRADVVDTHVDKLDALGQQVVAPVLLAIGDDLGHRHEEGHANGQRRYGRVAQPEQPDNLLCADAWNFQGGHGYCSFK